MTDERRIGIICGDTIMA